MKKKFLGFVLASAMILPVSFAFTGCCDTTSKVNARDIYSFVAVSSGEYLSKMTSDLEGANTMSATARPESITENDVKNLNSYLSIFEDMVKNNGITHTTTTVTNADAEQFQGYKIKMSVSLPTVLGQTQNYVMYFNETNTETNMELDEKDEEIEVSTTLEGVMVMGTQTYSISGVRTVEQEDGETETEIEFVTLIDEDNRIEVSQSIEEDEVEYEYRVFKNGVLVNKTEVEFEDENNQKELSLEFKDLSAPTVQKTKFEIKQKKGSNDTFEVEYVIDNTRHELSIKITAEGAVFTYENGFSETLNR